MPAIKKLTTAAEQILARIGRPILYWALELIDAIDAVDMNAQTSGFDNKTYDNEIEEQRLKLESYPSSQDFDSKIQKLEELVMAEAYKTTDSPSNEAWPVGSIFISIVDTNPADLLGYGTWEAFGTGRMLIGVDPADPDFDIAEETGGAKTHDHPVTTSSEPSASVEVDNDGTGSVISVPALAHTHDVDLAEINHMPPYIAVYMWKRTA